MILVTGAGGKTGQAVIRALAGRGAVVRAFVRREEQRAQLLSVGAAEAQVGDILDRIAVEKAVQGIEAIYHIPPNVHPQEVEIGEIVLAAAKTAGVNHFVYHSVLHPQIETMPHHWLKMRVEEMIFTSGMDFTILQPCAYMQNILGFWPSIIEQGVYAVPYAVEARISIVDLNDVAEAVAIVLTESGRRNAVYELAGPQALSQMQVAETLSEALGIPVAAQQTLLDEWQQDARKAGLGAYALDTLSKMFIYYDAYGLVGNGQVLEMVLGKRANDFKNYVSELM